MLAGLLALTAAAIFTGAALYVSACEQPARLHLADGPLLTQWKPAYARGYAMQAPLAIAGFALGVIAWGRDGQWLWIAGALAMVANWPYTLLIIMPVNKRLEAIDPAAAAPDTRALVERWGRLHAGRTLLGAVATILFLCAALRT